MKFRVNYLVPGGKPVTTTLDMSTHHVRAMVYTMIKENPDTIFFLTTDTTDIWEDE